MAKLSPKFEKATDGRNPREPEYPLTRKRDRVAYLLDRLEEYYPETPVPLDHTNAFTLLVAVLLSAQCTDERVNQVTPELFSHGENPGAMVALGEDAILQIVRPCGLGPQKARAIFRLSGILLEKYAGKVPADLAALESLPGVGHKTAQVVMAQAFGQPAFPVDTHIHRLAQRWGLTNGKSVAQTEKDLKRLFPEERWNRLHLQIIFFGRQHCTARKKCDGTIKACPFCTALNRPRSVPRKTRKA